MAFPSHSGTTHSDIRAAVLLCLYGRQVHDIHLEFYFHFLGIVTHGKNTRNLGDRCSGHNNRLQHKEQSKRQHTVNSRQTGVEDTADDDGQFEIESSSFAPQDPLFFYRLTDV